MVKQIIHLSTEMRKNIDFIIVPNRLNQNMSFAHIGNVKKIFLGFLVFNLDFLVETAIYH